MFNTDVISNDQLDTDRNCQIASRVGSIYSARGPWLATNQRFCIASSLDFDHFNPTWYLTMAEPNSLGGKM
jgi:hypothetical protein